MTMLTHPGGSFKPTVDSAERRGTTPNARRARVGRFFLPALAALLAVTAAGGALLLRTTIYFWRLHS